MSTRLLLVDNSAVMRSAIRQLLKKELNIEVIGTATSFAEALVLVDALKPDVFLMDLHMRDEGKYSAKSVKSQIHLHTKCIVAMSLLNDGEAKALAEGFGAQRALRQDEALLRTDSRDKAVLPQRGHSENRGAAGTRD